MAWILSITFALVCVWLSYQIGQGKHWSLYIGPKRSRKPSAFERINNRTKPPQDLE